jgi:hypothetical protein
VPEDVLKGAADKLFENKIKRLKNDAKRVLLKDKIL